jgi:hypothetical protein
MSSFFVNQTNEYMRGMGKKGRKERGKDRNLKRVMDENLNRGEGYFCQKRV